VTSAATAAVLFAITLATRLPLLTTEFWAHDSVLYTRALSLFDPADHRPQPPGYLYYVLLIRAVDALVADPVRSMTLISAVASATAVALLYVLAARMYDDRTGAMAALFLMTSVTFWGESLVALPYTLLAALTVALALLLWRVLDPWAEPAPSRGERGRRLAVASLAWGVAIGFRSDLAWFLAPVWLVAALRTTFAWAAASAAIVGAATLSWLAATVALTPGGPDRYFVGLRDHLDFIDRQYSVSGRGLDALLNNVRELARFMGRALFALVPLLAAVLVSRGTQRIELREPRRAAFLLLWALAPLPVNLFVHAGEYGYVFSMLPGLCVIAARGTIGLVRAARVPRLLPWLASAAVAVNAGIFLFSDEPLSRRDVAKRDRGIAEKVAHIAPATPPERVIVVTAYDQVLIETLLPGRARVAYLPDATPTLDVPLRCPASACTVFAWDEYFRTGPDWRTVPLPSGSRLRTAEVTPGTVLRVRAGLTLELAR
jgi:hypothetical protein